MTEPAVPSGSTLGGRDATYRWAARRRPFVHPLRSPAGDVLTVDEPADHPWHHGLWFAIKYVNGDNFWEEYDAFGVVRHLGPPDGVDVPVARRLSGQLHWTRPDRETVVIDEHRVIEHSVLGSDAYALDWTIRLRPRVDVLLDRTPYTTWGGYGGLTLRGRADWHDTRLLTPHGETSELRGERAPWCDLTGPVGETGRTAGVLVLDDPDNTEHPTPWYASTRSETYGDGGWSNFCNAAFLWDGPLPVAAGDELVVRHRVVVHDGWWDGQRCSDAHRDWLVAGGR